jgi:hypothetical protein
LCSILEKKPPETLSQALFIKVYIACLMPYPTEGIITTNEVNVNEIERLIASLDLTRLEMVNTLEDLLNYIIDFYSQRVLTPDKFKKTMCAITLTQKGLTIAEIAALVTNRPLAVTSILAQNFGERMEKIPCHLQNLHSTLQGALAPEQ